MLQLSASRVTVGSQIRSRSFHHAIQMLHVSRFSVCSQISSRKEPKKLKIDNPRLYPIYKRLNGIFVGRLHPLTMLLVRRNDFSWLLSAAEECCIDPADGDYLFAGPVIPRSQHCIQQDFFGQNRDLFSAGAEKLEFCEGAFYSMAWIILMLSLCVWVFRPGSTQNSRLFHSALTSKWPVSEQAQLSCNLPGLRILQGPKSLTICTSRHMMNR